MQDLPSIEDLLNESPEEKKAAETALPKERLEEKMHEIRLGEKEAIAKTEAELTGTGHINLVGFPISPEALALVPEKRAKELQAVSFLYTGPEIRLGCVNPNSSEVESLAFELSERYKANVRKYKVSEHSFEEAIKLYAMLPKIRKVTKGVSISDEEIQRYRDEIKDFDAIQSVLSGANTTDMVVVVTAAALELGSSDIHIEAEEKDVAVRLRIDGILQDVAKLPKESWGKVVNRIKLIAGLKMNITDRPQDGRYTIYLSEEKVDVRTSTLPTAFGESIVMRILRSDATKFDFAELGLRPSVLEKLQREVQKPHGMIVTTGPTGSGKTTTLYSILRRLNNPEVKIITLEDPIEYKLEGISQSQIDHAHDYTFAKGLRSLLRQDPDIVMVGEIRDLETAEIAIQAALTGHLLLSTIHTNDAAGAIPRFLSMGVKPFLLAPALNAIIGQRLVRRVCEDCKKEVQIDEATRAKVDALISSLPEEERASLSETQAFYTGEGCDKCNGTGYRGRIGIYELLLMTDDVGKAVLEGNTTEYQMRELAAAQGMITMAQDGVLKALGGLTTLDEVFRVTNEG